MAHASLATFKCTLANIPYFNNIIIIFKNILISFGGGNGGIKINPLLYS